MSPLTAHGERMMARLKKEYGGKKGEQVYYAMNNAGKLKGVEKSNPWSKLKRKKG